MTHVMRSITFADARGYADLATFVGRAKVLDADGAVRLVARDGRLAAYVGVRPGVGLLADGAVLGLWVAALAEGAEGAGGAEGAEGAADAEGPGGQVCDVTVPLTALTDRFARDPAGPVLSIPATEVRVPWASITAPRSGWESVGTLRSSQVADIATAGIEAVATGSPPGAGSHAVTALRQQTWATWSSTDPSVPSGAAFAAYSLGFVSREAESPVRVFTTGRWIRLSAPSGHVITR